jgi:hypothetical protein
MRVEEFEGREPRFVPEVYFDGKVRAWGIFEDRFGRLRRQFTVGIDGAWDGQALTLTEDFQYDDGKDEQRVWVITKTDTHTYKATADSIVGTAFGRSCGNAIKWHYMFALTVGGRERHVRFDDWMFQQDDDVVINRAKISKWGVEIGSTTIFFQRLAVTRAA